MSTPPEKRSRAGAPTIPVHLVQRGTDGLSLDFLDSIGLTTDRRRDGDLQILAPHDVAIGENRGPLQRVAELAHIPRPTALEETLADAIVEPQRRPAQISTDAREQRDGERQDVLAPGD